MYASGESGATTTLRRAAPPRSERELHACGWAAALSAPGAPAQVNDISLEDYIAVKPKFAVYVPHTAGRYQKKRFRKAQCPIVERCAGGEQRTALLDRRRLRTARPRSRQAEPRASAWRCKAAAWRSDRLLSRPPRAG